MSATHAQDFKLIDELNKTITKSLVTTFGLDFLLFEDKKGGEVATVHNARQRQKGDLETYMPQSVQDEYKNRGDYKPEKLDETGNVVIGQNGKAQREDLYHTHSNYIAKGRADKKQHKAGGLVDEYRDTHMAGDESRQLDHIIASHEVHNDAGRILAELNGPDIANQNSNFQSTHYYINNLKSNHSVEEFLTNVVPRTIVNKKASIDKDLKSLESMPELTKQQRHEKRQLEQKISKEKAQLEVLESIDHKKMLEADRKARDEYNRTINFTYYTSSKFLTKTTVEASKAGLKMGIRQALGMVFAEVWFELKDAIPNTFKNVDGNFTLEYFLENLKVTAKNIWVRVKTRLKDIFEEFKTGMVAGVLSSLTSTIMNIFFTTQKLIGKLLRETWTSLVSAAKVLFFNPNSLSTGALAREVTRILSTGVAVALGVMLNQHLATIMTFPFGMELASFISAVATGLMTIGITYFLDHSKMMQRVWAYLDQFKSDAKKSLEYFQKVNAELDSYLIELAKIEFNLQPEELQKFNDSLEFSSCELERSILLSREIERRGIELPFDANSPSSTKQWLMSL